MSRGNGLLKAVMLGILGMAVMTGCGGTSNNNHNPPAGTYSISGTVTLSGTGLANVTVTLIGAATKTVTTDPSGTYTFTGLANGSYSLAPSMTGYTFSPLSTSITINNASVTAVDFAAKSNPGPTYSISGTVTLSGYGLTSVTVTLTGATIKTAATDSSGDYTFTGLANGSYSVSPSMTGYTFSPPSSPVTINNGDATAIDFAAQSNPGPTYSITGTVNLSGSGLTGVTMDLTGAATVTATTDSGGNYTFINLSNGSYTITPSFSGYAFTPSSSPQTVSNADITGVDFIAAKTVVKPDPPTGLAQTTVNVTPSVSLIWSASAGATSYAVYFTSTASTCPTSGYTLAGTATGLAYTDTSLISGTTYCFAVTAKNSAGESAYSNITSTTILAVPSSLNATVPNDTSVSLTWGASAGAASYNVYTSTTSGSGYIQTQAGLVATTSTVTGLLYGHTYYFVVTAVNANGETGYSNEKGVYLAQTPNGLTASPGPGQVTLDWNATIAPSRYNIYDNIGYVDFTTGSYTSFTATSLTNGTTYNFTVTAVYGGVESAGSNVATTMPLSLPVVTLSEPVTGTVLIDWTQAEGYPGSVYEQLSPSGSWARLFTDVDSPQTWTGATDGNTYNFTVTAINVYSQEGSAAFTTITLAPDAPTGLNAAPGDLTAALDWNPSHGATGYTVYITTTIFSTSETTAATSYTVTGLAKGTAYYFTVTASNGGGESGPSNKASAIPLGPGSLDPGFNGTGYATNKIGSGWDEAYGRSITVDASGRILVAGYAHNISASHYYMTIWRYNSDGSPDTSFGGGAGYVTSTVGAGWLAAEGRSVITDASGNILVTGYAEDSGGTEHMTIWRYLSTGTLDTSFGGGAGYVTSTVGAGWGNAHGRSITTDTSGNILVTGYSTDASGYNYMTIWRYTSAGYLDTTFAGGAGIATNDNAAGGNTAQGESIIMDANGTILVTGYAFDSSGYMYMTIWRYFSNGYLDSNFNPGHNPAGVVTNSVGAGIISAWGFAVTVDGSDNILVAGFGTTNGTSLSMTTWRYTSSGALDTSFNPGGSVPGIVIDNNTVDGYYTQGRSIVTDADGNILIAGFAIASSGHNYYYIMTIWRYLSTGTLDTSFGGTGIVTNDNAAGGSNAWGYAVITDANGMILVTGNANDTLSNTYMTIWRYLP